MARPSAWTAPSAWRPSKLVFLLFQLVAEKLAAIHVALRSGQDSGLLRRAKVPHHLRRRSDGEHAGRNFLAFGHERICADQRTRTDLGAIEDHAVDADE